MIFSRLFMTFSAFNKSSFFMNTNNSGAQLMISTMFMSSALKLEEISAIMPFVFEASALK